MINFLNLEYFLVAAEELNFTRAARKLYISQQSLSNHISNRNSLQPHLPSDPYLCGKGPKDQGQGAFGPAG